jgi:hypothetical protein
MIRAFEGRYRLSCGQLLPEYAETAFLRRLYRENTEFVCRITEEKSFPYTAQNTL